MDVSKSSPRVKPQSSNNGLMLPWTRIPEEAQRFKRILGVLVLVATPLALWIPSIDLPPPDRSQLEALPPQLAKVILQKKVEPPPPPPPEPVPEEKPPEPKPPEPKPEEPPKVVEKPKVEIKKEPEKPKEKAPEKQIEKAREVAKKSGLLAMQDDLADMRQMMDSTAVAAAPQKRAKTLAASASAIDSGAVMTGSGGIAASGTGPSEAVVLTQREVTTLVQTQEDKAVAEAVAVAKKPSKERGSDNVRRTMDKNKSALYSIYNRELRKHPGLEGKVVLELTIEPSGEVSECRVISSDLQHPELESKLVSRVKLINFGALKVERKVVRLPIEFFPAN